MTRRIVGVLAALLVTAGLSFAQPAPASAALADCPSQRQCLWTDYSYGGAPSAYFFSQVSLTTSNNAISSVNNNRTDSGTCYYDSTSYTGFLFRLGHNGGGSQWRDPNLSNGVDGNGTNFDNRIGSAKAC